MSLPPSAPPSPPAPTCADGTSCAPPAFCHGTTTGSVTCEDLDWVLLENTQCNSFLPHNANLTTLDLAEAACGADDECGGVSDLYCNGMHATIPDHYALCDLSGTYDYQWACTFIKPTATPPAPPMPPPSPSPSPPSPSPPGLPASPSPPPPPAPCGPDTCGAPAFCHGTETGSITCANRTTLTGAQGPGTQPQP